MTLNKTSIAKKMGKPEKNLHAAYCQDGDGKMLLAPYQCTGCLRSFYTEAELNRHLDNSTDC